MAEADILAEFNDEKLNQTSPGQSEKLPKIDQPVSRSQARSKAEPRKTPPSLPFIKNSNINPADPPSDGIKSTA